MSAKEIWKNVKCAPEVREKILEKIYKARLHDLVSNGKIFIKE